MNLRKSALLLSLTCFSLLAAEETADKPEEKQPTEFNINLKDPVFTHGVVSTEQGGVVTAEGVRVQAQKIEYANRIENGNHVQRITAEGDLMVEFGGRAFVGKKLEYDFVTKTGTLWEGKTFVDIWFLGGEKISLQADGTYIIYNAFVTTSESQDSTWEIRTGFATVSQDHLLAAKNIRFNFYKIPVFWLPAFKSNLKWLKDPPVRYKVKWDKGLGPRISMRYRIYSWEHLNLYFRFDYRITRGPGGALEAAYKSEDERTILRSKNYGAFDKEVIDERGNKRYRLQGLYQTKTKDDKTQVHLTYDKMSDDKMPSDFKSGDFEVDTQERTILLINHQESSTFASLRFQPRVNRFQSLNQELPLVIGGIRPFEIGPTGIISQNYVSAGLLDYVFATDLASALSNKRAVRLETSNHLYRPIKISHATLTPDVGLIGIFYNNNPHHEAIGQILGSFGVEAKTRFFQDFAHFKHTVEPYALYQGLTSPTSGVNNHFIFSIDDGYARLNTVRAGVRNTFLGSSFLPFVTADLYTYAFVKSDSTAQTLPKFYADVSLDRPSYTIKGKVAWNSQENVWDFTNIRTGITLNQNLAFTLEFRHRSKYDWRKGNHENFVIDVARHLADLLDSPLSDGRNTFLAALQARLTPSITSHFETHIGWGRKSEPGYSAAKLQVIAMLTQSWALRGTLQYTPNGGLSPSISLNLVK